MATKKKKKKEGAVEKALRTWSPGKYIGKFIKGESIGVSEKTAKQRAKKAAENKASRKAETTKRTKKHKESVAKKDKGTGAKDWYPGKYAKKLIKGEPVGVPKSKQKAAPKKETPKKVAPQKFGQAFSNARKAGKKTFTWKGKSYTTKTADDVKKAKKVKPKGKTFGKESLKKAAKKATDVSDKLQYQTPMKDVIDTKDRLAKRGDYREETKDVPVKPDEPWKADEDKYRTSKAEGGIVESNPYGWPSRDARNGGNK